MDVTQLLALFISDPVVTIHTGMRFFHFIGLALGLGGAVLLDLMMLRFFLRGRIINETYGIVDFASKVVSKGLLLLWISGIGFLLFYALTKPELLTNPKVHAKLVIVAILTVNGYFIHSVILPGVRSQIGTTLFAGISPVKRSIFLVSGAISAVSWIFPVALGAFPQLNFAVPALVILSAYLLTICAAALSMHALILMLAPKPSHKAGGTELEEVLFLGAFPCAGTPKVQHAMPVYAGARRRRLLIEGQG